MKRLARTPSTFGPPILRNSTTGKTSLLPARLTLLTVIATLTNATKCKASVTLEI